jgi:hypothetical protein
MVSQAPGRASLPAESPSRPSSFRVQTLTQPASPERPPRLLQRLPQPPTLGFSRRGPDACLSRAVVVEANRLHGSKGIWTPASRAGVMRDLLKTMSPRARVNGKPVMPALEVHNKRQRPCTILGKRSGTSTNIGTAARAAAGWHELERLDELRAVLPTGDDARRERNQERQRRRRVERAYRSMSPWKPSPTSQEAEEDGLDADFFD